MAFKRVHPSASAISCAASVLIGIFGFVSTAHADVSSVQREACTPDAFRLCSSAIPDAGKVKSCMLQNKASLSERCRATFEGAPAAKLPSDTVRLAPISAAKASREAARKGEKPAPKTRTASTRGAGAHVASSAHHQGKTHHPVKTARAYRGHGGGYGDFAGAGLYGGNLMSLVRRDRPVRAGEAMGMARQMMITYRAACGSRSIPAQYCGF